MPSNRGFGSDNHSGVHPSILKSIEKINNGHHHSYEGDIWTEKCRELFSKIFDQPVSTYFVFNGTAANVLAVRSMCQSFQSVFCTDVSHLNTDECGAPEFITGCKLIPIKSQDGKLTAEQIENSIQRLGDQHYSQPKAISITQPTELGTVYSIEEIKKIKDVAKQHGLYLHVDGARLIQAIEFLECSFKDLISTTGVDVLSFGGTKNGLLMGEAVIFLNPDLGRDFKYMRKQSMQLPSKTKFFAIQFIAFLEGQLWKEIATHCQKMALYFEKKISEIPGITICYPVQANSLFVEIPKKWIKPLRKHYFFYVWNQKSFQVRLMTTYDTSREDIDNFIKHVKELVASSMKG